MRPEVQSLYCPASGRSFAYPSASQPIVDFSSFVLDARTDASRLSVLTGIAADGVARVGVVGADGAIHSVAVKENAYYAKQPYNGPMVALVALDAAGQVVYKHSLPR